MKKIRVGIVDDQNLFRNGLESLLSRYEELEITLSEKNGIDLLKKLDGLRELPDVLLLDIEMPEMDGFEACKKVVQYYPSINILMLSMYDKEIFVKKAILCGAHGYLIKDEEPEEIKNAINEVVDRGYYFNQQVSMSTLKSFINNPANRTIFKDEILSPREIEIVKLICRELTDKEIAEIMNISYRTVETYRKSIMTKIGARKSIGIALFALKNNYIIL